MNERTHLTGSEVLRALNLCERYRKRLKLIQPDAVAGVAKLFRVERLPELREALTRKEEAA